MNNLEKGPQQKQLKQIFGQLILARNSIQNKVSVNRSVRMVAYRIQYDRNVDAWFSKDESAEDYSLNASN